MFSESSKSRSLYSTKSRPVPNVASPYPLSEASPWLPTDDPISTALMARGARAEAAKDLAKRKVVAGKRLGRQREIARRTCERETVENYIQTPAAVARGSDMAFGVNVIDGWVTR